MRVAALISGGKDSALALNRALLEGHKAEFLVAMIPQREDSWMFHCPNIHLIGLFAESAAIPLVKRETAGIKEEELEDLKDTLSTLDVEGVVSGAIASQYQKQRIEKVCNEIGVNSITPLWNENPLKLLRELLELRFETIITGVYAHGFDESWLGRQIDTETIGALLDLNRKHGISLVGEGGEYETQVLDAPFFKRRIELLETERNWENQSGFLSIKSARLTDKQDL